MWNLVVFLTIVVVAGVIVYYQMYYLPNTTPTSVANPEPVPLNITVLPNSMHLPRTFTQSFTAIATYVDNLSVDITNQCVWSTSNSTVASISSNGILSALSAGVVTVTATKLGVVGTTACTVTNATLVAITITPINPAVARDGSMQLAAIGTFSDASQLDLTLQSTWTSLNDAIAIVGSVTGLLTGISGGSAIIRATSHAIVGQTIVFVGN